jgi:hypothetical protein
VTVARVFAETDVGYHDDFRDGILDIPYRLLNNSLRMEGRGAGFILVLRYAKEKNGRDAQPGHLLHL